MLSLGVNSFGTLRCWPSCCSVFASRCKQQGKPLPRATSAAQRPMGAGVSGASVSVNQPRRGTAETQ